MLAGCATQAPPAPSPPPEKPPITIAVISFGGSDVSASDAEDGCVMALLEAGYRIVDRARVVAAVPDESDVDFANVGRVLGADLIVDGGWTRKSGAPPKRLESRLISTHSANVLGSARAKGRLKLDRATGRALCQELVAQLP